MLKLDSLRIDFENLEYIIIPSNVITKLNINDIHSVKSISYFDDSNEISKVHNNVADSIELEVDLDMLESLKLFSNFDVEASERLQQFTDISSLTLRYNNGSVDVIDTVWNDPDDRDENSNQDNQIVNYDFDDSNITVKFEPDDYRKNDPHYKHNHLQIEIFDWNK